MIALLFARKDGIRLRRLVGSVDSEKETNTGWRVWRGGVRHIFDQYKLGVRECARTHTLGCLRDYEKFWSSVGSSDLILDCDRLLLASKSVTTGGGNIFAITLPFARKGSYTWVHFMAWASFQFTSAALRT